nr:unnamed protein product [Digitaria exilis]
MSFLQDVHPEVIDALLGFVYDPLDPSNAALDDLLNIPPFHDHHHDHADADADRHCAKKQRAWHHGLAAVGADQQWNNGGGNLQQQVPALPGLLNQFALPPLPSPPPPRQLPEPKKPQQPAAGNASQQSVQSAAARQRRKRISEKTAELSRLIPGGHKLNTAEMLQAAARHVKLLQTQVGMLALMHNSVDVGCSTEKEETMSFMAAQEEEQMQALLACGGVQERLAAEGRCLVPTKLVDAMAKDSSLKSNALVNRDLGRFVASLQAGQ